MDANYWSSMQASNRANVPVANVVDLNQSGIMPYSGVEVIPAASLELLMNQQRLAGMSGISFLPYHGAAYAAQVLDSSAVPAQTIIPGVTYNAVTTTAVQAQLQYGQPVTSSYGITDYSLANKNAAVANTVPVLSTVNPANNGQSLPLKQPLQSINLTDLLDYSFLMEHGMGEAPGTVDLRNPAVLANMLQQSLNAGSLPSASCSDDRITQPVDNRQFPVTKQPVQNEQPFQETMTVGQQQVPLSNRQLPASQLYASYGTVASSASVLQSSQQKDIVHGGGVLWPWSDPVLIADKSQNEGAVAIVQSTSVASSVSSSSLPVTYEAVSPPSASVDNMSFSLLDNLQLVGDAAGGYQLTNFQGSTVDTSALFAAASPYSLASASQHSRTDTWNGAASASYSATANARLQPGLETNERSTLTVPPATSETTISRQSFVELEKMQKQKSNLGIVLPMTHGNTDEKNSTALQASSLCRTSVAGDIQSAVEPQNQYLTNSQLSAEKSSGSVADTATGGIVLTNITGNVYVNQYTMLPGGAQPLDNTLLHADLAVGGATGSLSYDSVVDESSYSLAAPSVAVLLKTTEDELNAFAAEPMTSVANGEQHTNLTTAQKSVAPESSFFGAEATPVLNAKPSNKFESCFLQFICGHKAETLSSVLNSPIKTRPVLPKYIPEPRRQKVAEVTVDDVEEKTEALSEPSSLTVNDTTAAPSVTGVASLLNPDSTATSVSTITSEWPSVTKLPAKFSHKWKNRTSLSSTEIVQSTAAVTAETAPKAIEVVSSKPSNSSVGVVPSSGGKTKHPSTKWTVSKKSKCTDSQSSGLPVLVLKAVPVTNTRSSAAAASTKTSR